MSTEAPPKFKRATSRQKFSDERVIYMTKTSPELDNPRLATYQQLGYAITEEPWRYKLTGSQAEFERRQKEYQQKGIAQAERVSKTKDSEGADSPREETISTITRVPMKAEDILSGDFAD
jgi:hypothetical protein